MKNISKTCAVLAALGVIGYVASVEAVITINAPRTFDVDEDGWTADSGVTATQMASGGNPGGYLEIEFPYGGPPLPLDPTIANSSSPYTGDYTIADAIQFDFIAFDHAPAVGSAVTLTTATGGTWTHAFTYLESQVGSWVHYTIALSPDAWTGGTGSFSDAILSVTSVGLDIEGSVGFGGTQQFGIDNWQYTIPEPRTYFMLAAALLGLATTFRRPIQDAIANLKKG